MNTLSKPQIQEILLKGECVVEFTKLNGEKRTMPCTLKESLIPKKPAKMHVTNTDNPIDLPKERKENPEVVNVWCTDKQAWRGFRIDKIISIKEKQ